VVGHEGVTPVDESTTVAVHRHIKTSVLYLFTAETIDFEGLQSFRKILKSGGAGSSAISSHENLRPALCSPSRTAAFAQAAGLLECPPGLLAAFK